MPRAKAKSDRPSAASNDRVQECVIIATEQARIEDLKAAHTAALSECRRLAAELRSATADQAKRVRQDRESNLFGAAPLADGR